MHVMLRFPSWSWKGACLAASLVVPGNASHRETGLKVIPISDQAASHPHRIRVSGTESPEFREHAIKSILNVRKQLGYGAFVWDDDGVPSGDLWIRVDLRTQMLSVFRGGHEIGTAVILYGGDEKPTPTGEFSILWKGENHRSSLYDAKMPYTLRLTGDGVAIHGANVRARYATNGCISVPTEFARLLFGQAGIGTKVTIVRQESAKKVSAV